MLNKTLTNIGDNINDEEEDLNFIIKLKPKFLDHLKVINNRIKICKSIVNVDIDDRYLNKKMNSHFYNLSKETNIIKNKFVDYITTNYKRLNNLKIENKHQKEKLNKLFNEYNILYNIDNTMERSVIKNKELSNKYYKILKQTR